MGIRSAMLFLLFKMAFSLNGKNETKDLLNDIYAENEINVDDIVAKIYKDIRADEDDPISIDLRGTTTEVPSADLLVKEDEHKKNRKPPGVGRLREISDGSRLGSRQLMIDQPTVEVSQEPMFTETKLDPGPSFIDAIGSSVVSSVKFVWRAMRKFVRSWYWGGWY